MLSDEIVEEIHRLLREGRLSRRAIAERLGISHGSVANVVHGRRNSRTPRTLIDRHLKRPTRCLSCGGMVYKPCRLCRARAYQRVVSQIRLLSQSSRPDGPSPRQAA
jgi:hypothetical protein